LIGLSPALAAGTLEGTVRIEGKIPRLKPKAKAYNPYGNIYKEEPASDKAEPSRHLLVYLEGVPGDYEATGSEPVLGQKDKQFTQDIVPVISGGKVKVTNEDTVFHHIRSSTKPWAFNLSKKAPKESVEVGFPEKGGQRTGVVPVYCDIHSRMRAHVVVLDNPFYALVDEQGGKFSIKGVPAGSYTLNAFHPTLKFDPIKVNVPKGKEKSKPVRVVMQGEK
jgi:plastocyanin